MKPYLRIAAALFCAAMLAACSPAATTNGDPTDGVTTEAPAPYTGYVLTVRDTALHPGADAAVLDALGEPQDRLEAPSCVHDGYDRVYYYAGFEVNTSPTGAGGEAIVSIYLTDDSMETDEGIRIGSTLDEVKAAYGDNFTEDGGVMTYARGSAALNIRLADGAAASIWYE